MTGTTLSPQAQSVLAAVTQEEYCLNPDDIPNEAGRIASIVSVALRAAADQVVPFAEITPQEDLESRREAMVWGMQHQAQLTRQQFRAIAAELREAQQRHEGLERLHKLLDE